MKVYSGVDTLPKGNASENITNGCLIIEGGAFRGVYDSGVLDSFMVNDINLKVVAGISAGALAGLYYVSGDIGTSGRCNLIHRHDKNWVGVKNMIGRDKGIFGFHYLFDSMNSELPYNEERALHGKQKLLVGATNCETGKLTMFANSDPDFYTAVQASASMPLVSKMVKIRDQYFLDGGCAAKVPFEWALKHDFDKIVVLRTKDKAFRREEDGVSTAMKAVYHKYPNFLRAMARVNRNYNEMCDKMDELEKEGRIFAIYPSTPVNIKKLEPDMEKLGELYWQGYNDAEALMPELKKYLGI